MHAQHSHRDSSNKRLRTTVRSIKYGSQRYTRMTGRLAGSNYHVCRAFSTGIQALMLGRAAACPQHACGQCHMLCVGTCMARRGTVPMAYEVVRECSRRLRHQLVASGVVFTQDQASMTHDETAALLPSCTMWPYVSIRRCAWATGHRRKQSGVKGPVAPDCVRPHSVLPAHAQSIVSLSKMNEPAARSGTPRGALSCHNDALDAQASRARAAGDVQCLQYAMKCL